MLTKDRWDPGNKGKFPEHLKQPLQRAGEAAFHYDILCIVDKEPTDTRYEAFKEKAFVLALCGMLPYNKLTLGVSSLSYATVDARNSCSSSVTTSTGSGYRRARRRA
jgi:hypothetical protein